MPPGSPGRFRDYDRPVTSAVSAPADRGSLDPHRLPRHVSPRRYEVRLEPHFDDATFDGRVVIEAEVLAATRLVVLNAVDLDVVSVHLDGAPAPFSLDIETERLFIGAIDEIAVGAVAIDIVFRGTLNDMLRGFYRSTYRDASGAECVVACSQMQATDCRRAFPCFDEPDFKAVFAAELVVADGMLAISNGPEIRRTPIEGARGDSKVCVGFADTMPMSTYLVAFVAGPLEATAPFDVGGVPLRIVHVPGKSHLVDFGLDVGAKSLQWFVDYYGIPYPDAKIDMVALPDFAAGAMENVGCITYRESLLLVDPATSTHNERELVADVVSHELAHMWFGDLVTMKWWNGIWLNEAFATFMEVAAVDAYRPDWDRWTGFSVEKSAAFETDSLASTRPVEFEVRSPADCEGMFDVLTYQKGGSLLRMLEQYLGPDRFRAGIRRYLTTHSYGNTETSDLWDAIEAAVADDGGEPVRRLMDSWIWQAGYPLVTASVEGTRLVLRQSIFSFDPDPPTDRLWVVPVHLRVDGRDSLVLLDSESSTVELPSVDSVVVVNAGGHGFYRVAYSTELLSRIDHSVISGLTPLDRYGLVDDAWNAVVAGRLTAADYLDFVASFGDESDLPVWQSIVGGMRSLDRLIDGAARGVLRDRVRSLLRPVLDRIGWEPVSGEADLVGRLRGLLMAAVATSGGDPEVVAHCRSVHTRHLDDPNHPVHPEILSASVTVVAATGDADDHRRMKELFLAADNPQEQLRWLYALTEFDDEALLLDTCEFAVSGAVKSQNAPFVLARSIANRNHGRTAWEFVRRHWAHAVDNFPSNSIVRMADPVKLLNTPEMGADARAFFAEHPIPQSAKTLDQILERHSVNIALRAREEKRLSQHLSR